MSGCLQHLLLSFQFDQVFHDSSCIHSSPLLPTFEQKTPFSNPITVLRIKCGIPWTCWEETDCGLHHHPLPSLCCFHLFSRTLLVPCQPQKAPVCSMSGIFAHNAFSWARLILLILEALTKAPFVQKENDFQLLPLYRTYVPALSLQLLYPTFIYVGLECPGTFLS